MEKNVKAGGAALTNEEILNILRKKWKEDFKEAKARWDADPHWLAKLVETRCILNGCEISIWPPDIGVTYDGWDQGFMETVQSDMERDLEAYGATDIRSYGFID